MTRWALKKFFWSMVFSSVVMIGTQVTPYGKAMRDVVSKNLKAVKNRAVARAPESVQNAIGAVPVAAKTVSASSNEYVFNDEQYVLIQGKYYKARPDNTYDVNGEKVYFVSNRNNRGQAASDVPPPPPVSQQPVADMQSMEMPTNPAEMMEALQKAQENMKKRNQMMKELEKDL